MKSSVRYSQNFLRNPYLVEYLLTKTNITATDTVYDIGGGKGAITKALAQKCAAVVAIEIDPQLSVRLSSAVQGMPNVIAYQADFLALPLPITPYKVFANIPFNISADIVRKLTDALNPPSAMYFIVQKAFADKLLSRPGGRNSQMSVLLGVRFLGQVVHAMNESDFTPRPKVATVCIALVRRSKPLVQSGDMQLFKDFVAYGFNAHNPHVFYAFRSIFSEQVYAKLAQALQFDTHATPTQLCAEQWVGLFNAALYRRVTLQRLVGGYETQLKIKHVKRVARHRTSA